MIEDYTPILLSECEKKFSSTHALSQNGLDQIHALRMRTGVGDMPDSCKMAVWLVAPVLTGFIRWIAEHIREQNCLLLGVMREGRLLCQLARTLLGVNSDEAHFNRHFCMLAAYDCGDDDALVNWLTRTRVKTLTHGELKKILPLHNPHEAMEDKLIDVDEAQSLVANWRKMGTASPIHSLAQSSHAKVWQHWKLLTKAHSGKQVVLMDFACAGNIQRSLQTLMQYHNDQTEIVGLNFVTTRGTSWAKAKGCIIRGFLAEDGIPEWLAKAYGRSPEVVEIFVAADLGPLTGYTDDGQALREDSLFNAQQKVMTQKWQKQILHVAKIFYDEIGDKLTPELCGCLWGRLLLTPLPSEIMALAHWPLDSGLEGSTPRPFAPSLEGSPKKWSKMQTGWPAASLWRQHQGI